MKRGFSHARHETVARELLALPVYSQLDAGTQEAAMRMDRACRALAEADSIGRGSDRIAEYGHLLQHPLASYAIGRNGRPEYVPGRSVFEEAVASEHGGPLILTLRSGATDAIERELSSVARLICQKHVAFRKGASCISPDGHGFVIGFPPSKCIPRRLMELGSIPRAEGSPPCFSAVVLMAAFLNLHPLTDGNGRLSRMLFNAVLRQGYPGLSSYLAVYELRRHAPFAFEIVLRSAEIHGKWLPLMEFFARFLDILLGEGPGGSE